MNELKNENSLKVWFSIQKAILPAKTVFFLDSERTSECVNKLYGVTSKLARSKNDESSNAFHSNQLAY